MIAIQALFIQLYGTHYNYILAAMEQTDEILTTTAPPAKFDILNIESRILKLH